MCFESCVSYKITMHICPDDFEYTTWDYASSHVLPLPLWRRLSTAAEDWTGCRTNEADLHNPLLPNSISSLPFFLWCDILLTRSYHTLVVSTISAPPLSAMSRYMSLYCLCRENAPTLILLSPAESVTAYTSKANILYNVQVTSPWCKIIIQDLEKPPCTTVYGSVP